MLTVAEVHALTEAMPEHLRAAIMLAAWGGLRRGEVLGLRRRDVDPMRSLVRVEQAQVELNNGTVIFGPPKTEAGVRSIFLPEQAMDELNRHLDEFVLGQPNALISTGRAASRCTPGP